MYDSATTIEGFLGATAARQPTPGGGAVAGLVGALAAALGEMVINFSIGPKNLEPYLAELKPALAELGRARELMQQLMVEDQLGYDAYSAARKLPKESPQRQEQLDAALLVCIRVPETIAATGIAILERCDHLVNFVNKWLLSDLAVCSDLAMAVIRCAIYSVRANLSQVTDPKDRQSIESSIGQLLSRAVELIQSVAPRIWERQQQGA